MGFRRYIRLLFIMGGLLTGFRGDAQSTQPTCTNHFYKTSYELTGDIGLRSLTIGPDGCMYMGCVSGYNYAIIKLDSLGDTIRTRTYIAQSFSPNNGKTIMDYDGNLFSVASHHYFLRTDTAGNILPSKQISLSNNPFFSFADMGMLANGDKVFLYTSPIGGYTSCFAVVTTPDGGTIKWTKYFTIYGPSSAAILADGDKVLVGVSFQSYDPYSPGGSGLVQLDGGTGAILRQQWFSEQLNFQGLARYNNGYIISGTYLPVSFYGNPSFYIRTDLSLNVLAANGFPAYTGQYSYMLFQPQTDGSVYGLYSSAYALDLFQISSGDAIQWANSAFGFYQVPRAVTLDPAGVFFGTD
jgi:hypothetical protein